ncbi:MAG: amidohydrolase [Lachnospiraceae bacterium]|jgi:amidohydrolase|nr:amidohydrolase [Lachnospiraceae bacterium]
MERSKQLMEMTAKHEALINETADYIWKHPETGYREWNTSAYMEKQFEQLGYTLVRAGNIPGFYADLDTGRPGPKVAVLGELDSLIVGTHPDAVPETCAVHACGHNAQCATLIGIAAALKEPGALDGMCGSIRFMAVPAEELIELGYRKGLRKQGIIKYFGGKTEFIARGYFDGVDMAMMIHSGNLPEGKTLAVTKGSNGCVTKNITFKGFSAHAGGSPEKGKNALYAATCGINAVNSLRETFLDNEHIRFHPILTEAGTAVNAIPETVKMETYVRGASYDSILTYNKKVNQALAGAAASINCNVELDDHPGYFPLNNDPNLSEIIKEAMEKVSGPGSAVINDKWGTGSTDMGDVSAIMPAVHPHASGAIGTGHGNDYYIDDKKLACLYPAQCLTVTVDMLLTNEAALAKKVIAEGKPRFASKEEFMAAVDKLSMDKDAVSYNEDGTITLSF